VASYSARALKLLILDDALRPQAVVAGVPAIVCAALKQWEDEVCFDMDESYLNVTFVVCRSCAYVNFWVPCKRSLGTKAVSKEFSNQI